MTSLLLTFLLIAANECSAVPTNSTIQDDAATAAAPIVRIHYPPATIIGLSGTLTYPRIEQFPGIPFAKPPTGSLRLRPPQRITSSMGTVLALENGKACPQQIFSSVYNDAIPTSAISLLAGTPLFQRAIGISEDCLVLNVHRPPGTKAGDKLPVLFWIFGGGFEVGWNSMYDGSIWTDESMKQNQPVIFVSVNYRVGGFGFLGGKEILADGAANLGLLDQRMGLEWVADNIAAFGGDPDRVTIWGESAGSISVFDQLLLYNGDNTYKGKPLFHGAIMNSGSVIPADPIDSKKPQDVYDFVVQNAGCSRASDTLKCLRSLPFDKLNFAMNSPPFVLSYQSLALSYLPRPDGKVLVASPDAQAFTGRIAKVPYIIGDQEDEGTLFALFSSNITTKKELVEYFATKYFLNSNRQQLADLVNLYEDQSTYGSPFRTGLLNMWYPQFKRLAAILGDLVFTISRRGTLDILNAVAGNVPSWSYLSSYDFGTPILGTFHASDLIQVFFGIKPNFASAAFHGYYINFVNSLNPNEGAVTNLPSWPRWSEGKKLLNVYPDYLKLIDDNFRNDVYEFLIGNITNLYF